MRKISLYITLVLIAAVFYSCSESQKPEVPISGDRTITVKAASDAADTKASYIYSNISTRIGYMAWDNGDQIGIFEKTIINPLMMGPGFYTYFAGLPNQNVPFTAGPGAGGSILTEFTGVMTNPGESTFYAYYPYSPVRKLITLSEGGSEYLMFDSPFPYNQSYVADSFTGIPAFAQYDCSVNHDNLNDALFTFKNLCNIIRFRVNLPSGYLGTHYLARIEVSLDNSNSYPSIPSSFRVTYINGVINAIVPEAMPNLENLSPSPVMTLDQYAIKYEIGGGGHLLSTSPGAYYHIALPPPGYEMGSVLTYPEMGTIAFIMSDGRRHEQKVDFSLLTSPMNTIYTVPNLTLNKISDTSMGAELTDPIEGGPASGFWI